MTTRSQLRHVLRWPASNWTAYLLALGTITAVVALIGGQPAVAVVGVVGFGLWAWAWRGKSDLAHDLLAPPLDERDLQLRYRSADLSQAILAPVLVVGFLVELAHGAAGPWTWFAALDGALLVGCQLYLRQRM